MTEAQIIRSAKRAAWLIGKQTAPTQINDEYGSGYAGTFWREKRAEKKRILVGGSVPKTKREKLVAQSVVAASTRSARYVTPIVTSSKEKSQLTKGNVRDLLQHVPSLGATFFRYTYHTPTLGGRKAGSDTGSRWHICINYVDYTLAEILAAYYDGEVIQAAA